MKWKFWKREPDMTLVMLARRETQAAKDFAAATERALAVANAKVEEERAANKKLRAEVALTRGRLTNES